MKLRKLSLAVSLALVTSVGVVGCHDDDDDQDVPVTPTTTQFTAVDGYLQNAIYCVDVNGDKQCSDADTNIGRTDINGEGSVTTSSSMPILVITDNVTTESDTKGVTGAAVTAGFFLTAPAGAKTITPLTTIVQVAVELGQFASFAAGAQQIATTLGLSTTEIDLTDFDYIAEANTQVAVVAEILSDAIAANIVALETATPGASATDRLTTAINLIVNPNNAAGVKGPGGVSLFEAIATAVQETPAEELETIDYTAVVVNNPDVVGVDDVDPEDLQAAVDEVTEPLPPTGGTGGTGGSGG